MASELQSKVLKALTPAPVMLTDDILFWKPFDAAPTGYYARFFGERACKTNVKGPHDTNAMLAFMQELSADLLDTVSEAKPLALSDSAVLAKTPLPRRVVVDPSLASGALSKPTEFMRPFTYGVFAAHRCEFTADDSRDEAAFRIAKVVPWSDWKRAPAPALSVRFQRTKSGVKSTGGKRMGVMSAPDVMKVLGHLAKEDGFIDIENFERTLAHVEHSEGRYEVVEDKDRWTLRADAVQAWLNAFAVEGSAAAAKQRASYVA